MTDIKELRRLAEELRKCTCHEGYTSRKLHDPNCQFHSGYHDDAANGIESLLDHIERQEALIAELRKDAWQPIETAPKDDTEILVGGMFDDWNGLSWRITVSQYLDRGDRRGHRHRNGARWATHWMPIPSAPNTSTQEVG